MNLLRFCSAALLGVTLAAPAMACGTSNVLLDDKFQTLDPAWGNKSDYVAVDNGKLVVKSDANTAYHVFNQSNLYGDADLCVTGQIADTAGSLGAVFWGVDDNNYYLFWASTAGNFGVSRKVNGRWLSPYPATASAAIKKDLGQTNELEVRAKGNHIVLLINGTQVAESNAMAPQGGGMIGAYGESDSQSAKGTAYFQEIKVTN
jgi:hypothetical protein